MLTNHSQQPASLTSLNSAALKIIFGIFGLSLLSYFPLAMAEAYIPSDNDIVYTISKQNRVLINDTIYHLQQQVKSNPESLNHALTLAIEYLQNATLNSNPRFVGMAEATLQPWWNITRHPMLNVVKARVLQFNHKFTEADSILTQVLNQTPNHSIARLQRANIRLALGQYQNSKRDCVAYASYAYSLKSEVCIFMTHHFSLSPDQTKKYLLGYSNRLINQSSSNQTPFSPVEKNWMSGILFEVALLNNMQTLAEQLITFSLSAQPNNVYLLGLSADLLIKQKRYSQVVNLLKNHTQKISLLVKLINAEKNLSDKNFDRHYQQYLTQIKEANFRDQSQHMKEKAYVTLFIENDAELASEYAYQNWQNQKELSDLALLYHCANITHNKKMINALEEWQKNNNLSLPLKFIKQSLIG